ncbi:acyl-CoA thioesterase [Thiomicrorhabdus sediminis]|uniref:Acyl-CoA thioesterase n=1 Tax=Thiomicrorhabdus sediminis TaxID=2580412 RepID=A0A4P9K7U5_9GAMM|nr:acyl-CoA thioesterase [Thiomicrorhabdus sediminis]QCU90530.1 acyl-CoA thioesterase [Thiomicrorhabdus sediminis]
MNWQHAKPFIIEHKVNADEIDHLNHVNNKVYLQWMEHISWQHSLAVGIDFDLMQQLGKVMVIAQHEMNFRAGCYLDDELLIGSWVEAPSSAKKRMRYYQIIRNSDQKTVFTGHTLWVCMDLETHKSCPIPKEFIDAYQEQY